MQLGMVGTDILHAVLYAGLLNTEPGPHPALPQDRHELERAAGGEAPEHLGDDAVDEVTTGFDVRADPTFADARVVAWWSADERAAAEQAAQARVPRVTADLRELVELVDAGLVCTWNGTSHLDLALPFLRAGKPVYVDKPLCEDVAEAALLVRTAQRNGTFFFSSSPWKWSPTARRMRDALPKLGALRTVVVTGPAVDGAYFYVIHEVELLQVLVGSPAISVSCTSDATHHLMRIGFADGTVGIVNGLRGTRWIRHAIAYGENGYLQINISNLQRDEGMVRMIREFCLAIRRDAPPLPMELAAEAVRILVAAERSAEQGGAPVLVDSLE
jgi:predicted dehydrogenase